MSAITANVALRATVSETFSLAELPSASGRTITHDRFNKLFALNSSSTPPATKFCGQKLTGPQVLDLTALEKDIGDTIDCLGLKLQVLLLNNLSETDDVVVEDSGSGASSSSGSGGNYSLNGGAALTVKPGGSVLHYFADQLADVAEANSLLTIDAAAGEEFEIALLFG